MADTNIAGGIRLVVARRLLIDDPARLPGDVELTDLGLDSAGMLDVVLGLEERFGIDIADDDITRDHLGTLDRIVAFVSARMSGP